MTDGDGRDLDDTRVATAFRLDVRGDTITAREDNVITYVSGDCGEFTESCEWSIEATGVTCANCVPVCGVSTEDPRVGGPLGWPVDVALASLRNAP